MKYVNYSWQMTVFLRVGKCFAENFSALISELAKKPSLLFVIYVPCFSKK